MRCWLWKWSGQATDPIAIRARTGSLSLPLSLPLMLPPFLFQNKTQLKVILNKTKTVSLFNEKFIHHHEKKSALPVHVWDLLEILKVMLIVTETLLIFFVLSYYIGKINKQVRKLFVLINVKLTSENSIFFRILYLL